MVTKFKDLRGWEVILGAVFLAGIFVVAFAIGLGILMGISALGIWAVNTVAGHVVLALTWTNVVAVTVGMRLISFVFRGK